MCAQKKFLEFIYARENYPIVASTKGIEGRSVVQFTVEKDESISIIKVVNSLGYGINEESRRIVELMNSMHEKWTPGMQKGTPVRVRFTLPVFYKLQ